MKNKTLLIIAFEISIMLLCVSVFSFIFANNIGLRCMWVILFLIAFIAIRVLLPYISQKSTKSGIKTSAKAVYVSGLNSVENTPCKIYKLLDKFEFDILGERFSLNSNKIIDISIVKNTDIQKQYVSSIGGATMGAILAGPLGAAIGGAAKQKRITNKTEFLIFSYCNDDCNTNYIVFNIKFPDQKLQMRAWTLDYKIKNTKKSKRTIDL